VQRGRVVTEVTLAFSGEQSVYSGVIKMEHSGRSELQVLAIQPETANFGIVKQKFKVRN
jgi:hypothetical protein